MDNIINVSEGSSTILTMDGVRLSVEATVAQVQELSGNPVPEFTDSLILLGGVECFDSLTAVEVLTLLSEKFEVELPDDIFYDPERHTPVTLQKVVERIYEIVSGSNPATQAGQDEH